MRRKINQNSPNNKMLIEKLSAQELEIAGYIKDPVFFAECLFTSKLQNHESLKLYDDKDYLKIRLYQLPYLSYEYLLVDDTKLPADENFRKKQGAGKIYCYTGRKTGKTLIALLVDILIDTAHNFLDWVTLISAFDEDHVANICEPIISALDSHPFFKLFEADTKRKPYRITIASGHVIKSINMNLSSREPGSHFESQHASKIVIDEHQYETEEVVKKRSQATSEYGTIERFAGITNFTKSSPAGNIFFNLANKNWIVNIPQTASPAWNKNQKKQALDDYGDESSPAYKIHIKAEVLQDVDGCYDIERIRECYEHNQHKPVKRFDIHQKELSQFKNRLIVERPKNAKLCFISSDFGENITEIIVNFELDSVNQEALYKYIYNITLYKMTPDEQTEIFEYLIDKLQAEYVGIDVTDGGGKNVYRNLAKTHPKEMLEWVNFTEKIAVALKYKLKDDGTKEVVMKDGKPEYEYDYVSDWSVNRIKHIFYNRQIDCLYDLKLDTEFNNMISTTNIRTKYSSKINRDHLHQSFQVFAIMEWKKNFEKRNKPKQQNTEWGCGVTTKM